MYQAIVASRAYTTVNDKTNRAIVSTKVHIKNFKRIYSRKCEMDFILENVRY
jgi:competence transcription factor ComK